jgi:moderate conductance mechanosensitive channel
MLGVDAFADSALIIRFYIKTKPLQQWPVKREMLLRIKKRFDVEQIEIPFPHRTIYHRNLTSELDSTEAVIKATDRKAA